MVNEFMTPSDKKNQSYTNSNTSSTENVSTYTKTALDGLDIIQRIDRLVKYADSPYSNGYSISTYQMVLALKECRKEILQLRSQVADLSKHEILIHAGDEVVTLTGDLAEFVLKFGVRQYIEEALLDAVEVDKIYYSEQDEKNN